jgi:tetrahydromethanopterin S-methyltransferase subunit C
VPAISFSLLAYVLAKTLDAIFKLLGDREAASRASNPILSALTTRAPASLIKAGSQALISFQVVVNGSMGAATRTDLTIATDSVSFLKCAAPAAAAAVCCRCCRLLPSAAPLLFPAPPFPLPPLTPTCRACHAPH